MVYSFSWTRPATVSHWYCYKFIFTPQRTWNWTKLRDDWSHVWTLFFSTSRNVTVSIVPSFLCSTLRFWHVKPCRKCCMVLGGWYCTGRILLKQICMICIYIYIYINYIYIRTYIYISLILWPFMASRFYEFIQSCCFCHNTLTHLLNWMLHSWTILVLGQKG